jgi:hypothetical protein
MKKILLISALALSLASCYNDKYDKLYPLPTATVDLCDTATNPSTYSGSIKPIMTQSCAIAGCHDAATAQSGYDLTQYSNVKLVADNGLMMHDINNGTMPQGMAKLSDCKINQLNYWIQHGALEN